MFDNTTAASLELLRIRPEFAAHPGFEAALRQRVSQLARFQHPAIAAARTVESLGPGEGLAVVSTHVAGRRLSEVIDSLDRRRGPGYAIGLIRQLTPALAALQEFGGGGAHGLLTPDRIVIGPDGRLVLTEHALGTAIAALRLPPERLRQELGLAVPSRPGPLPLDSRSDVVQLAFVALSLLLGRRLQPGAYPADIPDLMEEFARLRVPGAGSIPELRGWLARALQLEGYPFASALDAHDALNEVLDAATHRSFVAVRASGELAGAFARSMSHNRLPQRAPDDLSDRDAAPDETATQALGSWPSPTSQPFASEWEETEPPARPAGSAFDRAAAASLPPPPPPVARMRPIWRVGLAVLVLLVVAQGAFIASLMWRSRTAEPPPPVDTLLAGAGARGGGGGDRGPAATPPSPAVDPAAPPAVTPANPDAAALNLASLPPAPPPAAPVIPPPAVVSGLDITSDPVGARVTVNGERRGVTPLGLALAPGQYVVAVTDGKSSATRTLTVPSGGRANFFAALAPAGIAAGWVTFTTPLELQVSDSSGLLGSTSASRIMLPAGRHQLELSNRETGFQTSVTVEVQPGKTTTTPVSVPNGSLSINALPWANVFVDGRAVGTTPLANLQVPLGTHEIVSRHPQLGERRQTVVVTLKSPLRIVVDFAK